MSHAWSRVFGNLTPEMFDSTIRDRETWHRPGAGPWTDLIDTATIGRLIDGARLRSPTVSMADGRQDGPTAAVPPEHYLNADNSADPLRVRHLMDGGATLVISQTEEIHAPLGAFARSLETVFWHRVQTNLYLTPGGAAQGFRPHFDTHEVLVLQIEGRKAWHLYDGHMPVAVPTRATQFDRHRHAPPGEPTRTLILEAGDVLYLPRGAVHDAQTLDCPSLHATVGLLAPCWADALRALIDIAEVASPALRQRVDTQDPDMLARLPDMLATLAGAADGDRLRARMIALFLDAARPGPARALLPAAPSDGDRLRLVADALMFVAVEEGVTTLHARGAAFPVDAAVVAAVQLLEDGATPTMAELGAATGANVKQLSVLWRAGLVTW